MRFHGRLVPVLCGVAACTVIAIASAGPARAAPMAAWRSTKSDSTFSYLGAGRPIPAAIAVAGEGKVLPWIFLPGTSISTRAGPFCSARSSGSFFAKCSTFGWTDDGAAGTCSTGTSGVTYVSCSAMADSADPMDGNIASCSAGHAGGVGTVEYCSTSQDSVGAFCSAEDWGAGGYAYCSVGMTTGGGGGTGFCSAQGTGSKCSAYNSDGGGANTDCSAQNTSQQGDKCSVQDGNGTGNTCTSGASTPANKCSVQQQSGGQCSAFDQNGNFRGGPQPPGSSCASNP